MKIVMKKSGSKKSLIVFFSRLIEAARLVWCSSPRLAVANILLQFLLGVLPLAKLYLLKLLVDGVLSAVSTTDKTAAFEKVIFVIGAVGIVFLLSYVCTALNSWVTTALGQVVSDHVHDIIHTKSIELDLGYYEDTEYYDQLDLVKEEAPFRPINIVNGMVRLGQNSLTLLLIFGLLIAFHWAVPGILLVATLPGVMVRLRYAGELHRWRIKTAKLGRKGGYFHNLLLSDIYAKEIRLFYLGRLFIKRFREVRGRLLKEKIKIIKKQSVGELVTYTGGTIAVYGCLTYMAYGAIHGIITIGDLVMYVGAFQRGESSLQVLIQSVLSLYEDSLFISTISNFLELTPKVVESKMPKPVPNPLMRGIVFDNVSFRYPNCDRMVLDNINLSIRQGEVVGLIGENGSGKTTLIKLLCRFYDPTAGSIKLDGINIRYFEINALRRLISMVFQDYNSYQATVRENIWYGDINLPGQDDKIKEAGEMAGIDEIVADFPEGYETVLGKWFEHGEELSIGESQKLAIARTLLRDAQILVLDEPSSSLDAMSEYNLFKRFWQVAKGRTVILISHRLSSLKFADCIYVLKNGTVTEKGTHAALVTNGGTYAELFKIQAQGYK
jgi:ATP-binding cassette subfamily B protein